MVCYVLLMRSFSYSEAKLQADFCSEVWYELKKLERYFYKFSFNENDAKESMQKTLLHVLLHYNPSKGELSPYMKSLARTILMNGNRDIPVDFLEDTTTEPQEEFQDTAEGRTRLKTKTKDFVDDLIDDIILEEGCQQEIVELALQFTKFFILLGESLINKDTSISYFPDNFITECLKLSKQNKHFNDDCVELYLKYKNQLQEFVKEDDKKVDFWREADYSLVNTQTSRRVRFVDELGEEVNSINPENLILNGKWDGKRVVKIRFYDLYNKICDLIDDDGINIVKFTIGDTYIIKTLGGSLSILNPVLSYEYSLCLYEILTNLLHFTCGKYLGRTDEDMYFLVNDSYYDEFKNKMVHREVKGIDVYMSFEDITSSVKQFLTVKSA